MQCINGADSKPRSEKTDDKTGKTFIEDVRMTPPLLDQKTNFFPSTSTTPSTVINFPTLVECRQVTSGGGS